jgi:hypothetical protein
MVLRFKASFLIFIDVYEKRKVKKRLFGPLSRENPLKNANTGV